MESNKTNSIAKLAIIFIILFIMTILLAFKATAALSDNVVFDFSFNDLYSNATHAIDTTGQHNGTRSGGVTSGATGHLNEAYNFVAADNEYVLVEPAGASLQIENYNFTYTMWAKPGICNTNVFTNFGDATTYLMMYIDATCHVGTYENTGTAVLTADTIPIDGFTFLVYAYNGSHMEIYINGTSKKLGATTIPSTTGDSPMIGRHHNAGNDFQGELDQMTLFNRTLSPAEILDLFNAGPGREYDFTDAAPPSGEVTQQTFTTTQTGITSLTSSTYQTIFSGSFNTSNITEMYSYYTVPLLANLSNTLTCRIDTDGSSTSPEVVRNNTAGAIGNMQVLSINLSVIAGIHTQELQCKVSGGGEVLIGFAKGVGNIMSNRNGTHLNYKYKAVNASSFSGASFSEITSFNFTTGITNTTFERVIAIDWFSEYQNFHSSSEELNLQIRIADPGNSSDATNCSFYPRDAISSEIGNVGGNCLHRTAAQNTNYTVSLYGTGTNTSYNFLSHMKELYLNSSGANTTGLNGTLLGSATLIKLKTINVSNTGINPATLLARAGISSRTASGSTTANFQINIVGASEQNGTPISQTASTSDMVLVVQEGFRVATGDFIVELWGSCAAANCELTGGDFVAYMTETLNLTLNSFNVTVFDAFNGSSIPDFTATIENGSGFQSTAGVATVFTTASLVNLTISSTDYFNKIFIDHNANATLNTSLHQAEVHLDARELITSNNLSGVTFFVGNFSGTDFNLTAGEHTVTAQKTGYFNLTQNITVTALYQGTLNLTGMYNGLANISIINGADSSLVSTFTISVNHSATVSTTNGSVFLPLLQNVTSSINISGPTIASLLNQTILINKSEQDVNYTVWDFNSLRFNIFNESNLLPLNQSVTVHTISNLTTFTNATATGFIIIDLLQPNAYEIRFESAGFNPRSIFIAVTNDSTQNLSVYMTENLTTEIQVIEVLDTANQPVEGAIVWLQKEKLNISERWITIQEAETDYSGETSVYVERDVTTFYRFAVIYEGTARPIQPSGNLFTGKTSFIPGITETIQLIIDLQEDPEDFISDALAIAINCSWINLTASCLIIDGRNSITGAEMRIEASYINETLDYEDIATVSFSGSSGTLNYTVTEINNSIWRARTYVTYETSENLVWDSEKRFDIDVLIEKNTGLLYAVIILAVVFLLTVALGPLVSGLLGFAILIPLTYIKLISIPIGIITGLLALVIIFFFRTRKQDE